MGEQSGVLVHEATRNRKLLYLFEQVRTTASSRNQNTTEGKGGVLIYVTMNISE